MSIIEDLKKHIPAIREIESIEANLRYIKEINYYAQQIAIITGLKLGDIYTEQDKKSRQERELSFQYDRDPFIQLEKQQEHNEFTNKFKDKAGTT